MKNLTQNILANIVKSCYAKGMSRSETMNIIERTFLLPRESCLLCQKAWRDCTNKGKQND